MCRVVAAFVAAAAPLLSSCGDGVRAFTPQSPRRHARQSASLGRITTLLKAEDAGSDSAAFSSSSSMAHSPFAGRHFELEELEDAESSTTDVLLNADSSVTLGGSNGPVWTSSSGSWEQTSNVHFVMVLTRSYKGGREGRETTDMGEFQYDVTRTFRGEVAAVGGTVLAVNGDIVDVDEVFGDRRVGFFNMIDTTEEKDELGLL